MKILNLYNQLINPIGLDRTLIEELKPSTNHEYISSKYHNENKGGCKQDNPINDHTPIIAGDDTNILRVNNLYTFGIERLFTVYNINNNTHAREFNVKTCVTDFAGKNNDINKPAHTNSTEIKTLYTEEKKSSYADLASCSLAEQKQSAFIATNIIS